MNKVNYCALFLLILSFGIARAEVTPPNYNFNFDDLNIFMPGNPKKAIEEKYPKGVVVKLSENMDTYKYQVRNERFVFPIFVQYKDDKVTDFYINLPTYFSHDIFHTSIIKRYGKQDLYKKIEEQAIYIWNKKAKFDHFYSGACTITCFPVFYAVSLKNLNEQGIQSLKNYFLNIEIKNQNKVD